MLVVSGVEHHLYVTSLDVVLESEEELGHELALRAGTANRNEEAQGLLLCPPLDTRGAVRVDVVHHVLGTPVTCKPDVRLRHAHLAELVEVRGTLHQVRFSSLVSSVS